MPFLTASLFLKALGWALVNSIWQFACCSIVYQLITASGRKWSSDFKHSLALCTIFTGTFLFVAECCMMLTTGHGNTLFTVQAIIVESKGWFAGRDAIVQLLDALMPWWSLVYIGGIMALFLKLVFFVRRANSLCETGTGKLDINWRLYVNRVALQLGIRRQVNAFLSVHVDTPQVIGYFKPFILIPAACFSTLSAAQLEAVLLHELVHIKRNDYLVNVFVATIEILFFFNPFARLLTAQLRKEREYSCDDTVIRFRYDARVYASALVVLEKNRSFPVTYGIAVSGRNEKQLLTRVQRLIGLGEPRKQSRIAAALFVVIITAFIASIKPADASIDSLGPATLSLALSNSQSAAPALSKQPAPAAGKPAPRMAALQEYQAIRQTDLRPVKFRTRTVADIEQADDDEAVTISDAALAQRLDFSMQQPGSEPKIISDLKTEPFIPANSFSFQMIQDTGAPPRRGESYAERKARESKLNAGKALAELDWQLIEKKLKTNPREMQKLKQELSAQLQRLNWEKINDDTRAEVSQSELQALEQVRQQELLIKQYQLKEGFYEALKKQVLEQQQMMQEADQRAKNARLDAEENAKRLQAEMAKRRIIYI